jgi:hypothetical protein
MLNDDAVDQLLCALWPAVPAVFYWDVRAPLTLLRNCYSLRGVCGWLVSQV